MFCWGNLNEGDKRKIKMEPNQSLEGEGGFKCGQASEDRGECRRRVERRADREGERAGDSVGE